MHYTQKLARANGKICCETGRPMNDSNPYRRGSKSYASFEAGYRDQEALAQTKEKAE